MICTCTTDFLPVEQKLQYFEECWEANNIAAHLLPLYRQKINKYIKLKISYFMFHRGEKKNYDRIKNFQIFETFVNENFKYQQRAHRLPV